MLLSQAAVIRSISDISKSLAGYAQMSPLPGLMPRHAEFYINNTALYQKYYINETPKKALNKHYLNFILLFVRRSSIITKLDKFYQIGGYVMGSLGGFEMIIMIVVMIGIFYFFMIRPENKKKKKLAEMRNSLAVGDTITTIGGIFGKVVSVSEDKITFETGEDRVRIQVARWAVSTVGRATEEPAK